MKTLSTFAGLAIGCLAALAAGPVSAKVSAEEAAKLGISGTELTPLGAIRAGNADGSIPAWEGGIKAPPAGYEEGKWYVDPYKDDKVLFTITAQNYQQYEDKLSPGVVAMLKKYPDTYKLNVYQSRRSASMPQWLYEGSIWNASNTEWCNPPPGGPNTAQRCVKPETYRPGIFFPIPKDGGEAMYNHTFYFFGKWFTDVAYGFNAFPDGTYAEHTKRERWLFPMFMTPDEKPKGDVYERKGGAAWCFSQEDLAPPRTAGTMFSGCNYFESVDFDAYLYVPGQRRVRKAPEIGFYDSPGTGSDGLRTADARNLFAQTGDEEWYDWSPPVRKEMYIPYNSYKIADPQYSFKDMVQKGHVNSDLKRWELHRVWVIEGKLKQGYRHLGPHRLVYVDEDSWAGALSDMYDAQGNLWRVSEAYLLNYYNVPMVHWWGDDHSDLISGRHTGTNAYFNHGAKLGTFPPDFSTSGKPDPEIFTPAGLRKYGVR
jgi:hypothetical protein